LLPKMIIREAAGKPIAIAFSAVRCSAIHWHIDNVAQNENAILSRCHRRHAERNLFFSDETGLRLSKNDFRAAGSC
jgi:hypothetical protein